MAMLIISPGRDLKRWTDALQAEDPSVPLLFPGQVQNPAEITFALAWDHPSGIFRNYPNLRCISSFGAGVDHLINDADIPPHIRFVRIIDPLLSNDMFEFTLAVVMKHLRKLTRYCRYQRESTWKKHAYLRMADVCIGVMGTGVIGHHVATGLQKAGFRVCGWGRDPGRKTAYKRYHGRGQLRNFLSSSNILVNLLPLTSKTVGIINSSLLNSLPPGAYLVNLGRGTHVVEEDLIHAIDSGHLSGAHLDVFDPEPLPGHHPFWSHPGIDISPHVASLTDPCSVAPQIMENYHRNKKKKPLKNLISRELEY